MTERLCRRVEFDDWFSERGIENLGNWNSTSGVATSHGGETRSAGLGLLTGPRVEGRQAEFDRNQEVHRYWL